MVRREIECVLKLCKEVPPDQLPQFIGELAEVSAVCFARLATPAPETKSDALLDVKQAAARMRVSPSLLYKRAGKFPFTKRIGRKLLFSSAGLDAYLRKAAR
jgi:hypothetical protein